MGAVPHELASWIDAILGAAPIEVDRAAGALLRYCRDRAGALREARSIQLDRLAAPSAAALGAALAEQLAGDWVVPARLAALAAPCWEIVHGAPAVRPGDVPRAAVARAITEALDDAVGHRYVSIFRRRGAWRVAPGEPFPVVQADLRRLFTAPLVTLPDRREAPIDRTRRLALAPAADGIEVVLDLSHAAAAAPPAAGDELACALPIAAPSRELDWSEARGARPVFHDVRPRAAADVAARAAALIDEACARGAAIVVFPELSVDDEALARVRARLADAQARPALVVAGSRHVHAGGQRRNLATLITPAGEAVHAKFNPYFAGERLEDIALVPAEVRAHGLVDDGGRLAFSAVVLVCKDFLAPGAQRALEALRPSLVVVPAWSQKTAVFEADAVGLTGKTQAVVVVANQADPAPPGAEDPAVLIVTRPVPALGPVIVRRSEVAPPRLVVARLGE